MLCALALNLNEKRVYRLYEILQVEHLGLHLNSTFNCVHDLDLHIYYYVSPSSHKTNYCLERRNFFRNLLFAIQYGLLDSDIYIYYHKKMSDHRIR